MDFDALFRRLARMNPESYNLESYLSPRFAGLSMQDYLNRCYRGLTARIQWAGRQSGG